MPQIKPLVSAPNFIQPHPDQDARRAMRDEFDGWAGHMGFMNTAPRDGVIPAAADELASKGRFGDTEIGHLTPGEIVVPVQAQTPGVLRAIKGAMGEANLDFGRYVVGGPNRVNPKTGAPEFSGYDGEGTGGGLGGTDGMGYSAGSEISGDTQDQAQQQQQQEQQEQQERDAAIAREDFTTEGRVQKEALDRGFFGNVGIFGFGRAVGLEVEKAVNNPLGTLANVALGLVSPPIGLANSVLGLTTGKNFGTVVGGLVNGMTGPNATVSYDYGGNDYGGSGGQEQSPYRQYNNALQQASGLLNSGYSFGNVPLPNLATGQSLTDAQRTALADGTMFLGNIGQSTGTPAGVSFVSPVKNRFRDEWSWANMVDSMGSNQPYGRGNGWGSNIG
jgi:hypothetical protein